MPKTNDSNVEKYHQSVKDRGYENLKVTPAEVTAGDKAPELIAVLVAEGMTLLKADETAKSVPTTPTAEPVPTTSKNPYVQARERVLKGMTDERRERIEKMEASGKTDNPHYKEFTDAVMKLGDKLSDKKS